MSVFVHDVKSSSEDKVIINGDIGLGLGGWNLIIQLL